MEEKWVVTIAQPIIDGQGSGGYGAVRLVLRQDTAGAAILKKLRDIVNIPDIGVAVDRMAIVEMKAIIKMVGINQRDNQQDNACIKQQGISFHLGS